MARVDVSILREIARIIQSRARVPERVQLKKRAFLITYLDDHKQRIEEALRRHDPDRLNMLFGQLESKVKYQVIRRPSAAARERSSRRSPQSKAGRSKSTSGQPTAATGVRSRPKARPKLSTKRPTNKATRKKKGMGKIKPPARQTGRRNGSHPRRGR